MKKPIFGYSDVVRKDSRGDPIRWNVYGWISTPLDDPNEPLRTYSVYGWAGSKKYPFGKPFPDLYQSN